MKIPLVSQQIAGGGSGGILRSTSVLFSAQAKLGSFGLAQRLTNPAGSDDAVIKKSLEEPKDLNEVAERDQRGITIGGYLGSGLRVAGDDTEEQVSEASESSAIN